MPQRHNTSANVITSLLYMMLSLTCLAGAASGAYLFVQATELFDDEDRAGQLVLKPAEGAVFGVLGFVAGACGAATYAGKVGEFR